MKKFFTLLFIATISIGSAQAWKGEQFDPANSYYIQNTTNGQFLTAAPGFSTAPETQWTPEFAKNDDDEVGTYNFRNGSKYIYIYDSWKGWNYDINVDMRNDSYRWRMEQQGEAFVYALRSNHKLATGNTFSQNKKYLYLAADGEAVSYTENATDAGAQWIFISEQQIQLMQAVASAQALMQAYTATPEATSTLSAMIESVVSEGAELPTIAAAYAEATTLLNYAVVAFKQAVVLEPGMDVTDLYIANPSFEQGPYLVNRVTGWEVTEFQGDGGEAFSSYKIDDRIFSGVEGDYLYNTWGGTPKSDYSLSQNLGILPAGTYELTFVVASDDIANKLNCTFGPVPYSVTFGSDKTVGIPVKLTTESDGETPLRIVLRGACWFKADAFHLVYKEAPTIVNPTAIHSAESTLDAAPSTRAYDLNGRPASIQNKGVIVSGGKKYIVR